MTTTIAALPADLSPSDPTRRRRRLTLEVGVALAAFVALCVAVLTKSTRLLEPDDFAYRASILALTKGHLTLSTAQYEALVHQLRTAAQPGIAQWVQLANGRWISEKNPGYPFLAAPFQLLGLLRVAPLFYGGLAAFGLYHGGRRWLGRHGGTAAVVLFCSSGAALVFAWRATMPTFTDASLIAAGTGALLWTLLSTDTAPRRRGAVGLLAFAAFEGATFTRYTDGVELAVAVVTVLAVARRARVPGGALAAWLGSLAIFVGLVAIFDALVYGGVTKTGYSNGEITFSLSAIVPNLRHMPVHLIEAMPVVLVALAAVIAIAARALRTRRVGDPARSSRLRLDAAVGLSLAASWLGVFGLYAAYTWTENIATNANSTIQVVRFYLPALGAVALLGAWGVVHLPRRLHGALPGALVATLVILGAVVYPTLATGAFGGGGPGSGSLGPTGTSGRNVGPPPGGGVPGGPQSGGTSSGPGSG